MSDDLVKHLRNSKGWPTLGNAAADRIEQLAATNEELEVKLERAVAFLQDQTGAEWPYNEDAKELLAELTGRQNDD